MEAAFEPADDTLVTRLAKNAPEIFLQGFSSPRRIRLYTGDFSNRTFTRRKISIQPDDVREWDIKWHAYFVEYTMNVDTLDLVPSIASWPKIMQQDTNEPTQIVSTASVSEQNSIRISTWTGVITFGKFQWHLSQNGEILLYTTIRKL